MKALILAAGEGRRLGAAKQKAVIEVGGKPMISHIAENIGFIPRKDTAVVVGFDGGAVSSVMGGDYAYFAQDPRRGTGDAVKAAERFLAEGGDVLVCYGDMPLISRKTYEGLLRRHMETNADCTVLTAQAPAIGLHYGRVIRGGGGEFVNIIEHNECGPQQRKISELNVGVYAFKAAPLLDALKQLKESPDSGEYLLTDIPLIMLAGGNSVETYTTVDSNEIYGVNTPEELIVVDEIAKRAKALSIANPIAKWFGTGGWRSIIGDDFIKSNVRLLAQAMADDMKSKSKDNIVIGFDRRFLSDTAAEWASEVFAANRITVYFITRIAPTPLVMFAVKQLGAYYGIAVTASHNPAAYNGIKVFTEGGRDAEADVTSAFERIIAQGVTPVSVPFDKGMAEGSIRVIDPNNDYIDSIISMIDMEAIRGGSLRVLLDPMFGVSKTTLQTILMTARCDIDLINDRRDALFGGRLPAPTEDTLGRLREMVVEEKYDLGLATDGDADRIGVIDSKGRYVPANEILCLLYHYLLSEKKWRGDVVRNLATTHMLDKIAAAFGQKCHEVPVGFKHISAMMEKTGAIIGGESSGGLTIRGHIKGKDGIFASSLIVEMICKTGKPLHELAEELENTYGAYRMAEFDARFSPQKKQELEKLLFTDKKLPVYKRAAENVSYEDGCKLYFSGGGWLITRFSGTEPLLRVFCEMGDKGEAEEYIKIMREFLGL